MSCKSTSTDPLVETAEAQRERERRTVDSFFAAFESGTSASPSPTAKTLAALAQADLDGLLLPGKDRPRSVLWKIYFGQIPPPESHQSHDPLASEPLASSSLSVTAADRPPLRDWLTRSVSLVQEERRAYHFQKRASDLERVLRQAREALLDPHPEEEDEEEPDGEEDPDPALELLKLIEKDVERTFPEIALFAPQDAHDDDDKDDEDNVARSQLAVEEEEYRCSIRAQLTAMLYVWCTSHPDVGYRQGIHELAAACYYVRWHDRLSAWRADALHGMVCVLLDETEAEADAYALFDAIMTGMKRWYEWRNPSSARTSPTPILAKSAAIMALLNKVDPALGKHLDEVGVEPQLFALRWVRLLFTREFPLDQALLLWDGLFAYDALEASQFGTFNVIALDGGDSHCRRIRPSEDGDQGQGQAADDPDAAGGEKLGLLNAICVAMLIRIRAYTLDEDYTQVITQLLRYPRLGQIATLAPEGDVLSEASAVALLVTQAARIRTLPGTSTGALIASENRAKLGVPVSIERPVAPRAPSLRPAPEPKRGFALPEGITDLARGVYDRSESFGIQKAVGSAVANMQRTVTAYAQQAGHARVQRHKVGSDGFPSAWEEVVPASHRARRLVQSPSGPRSLSGELPPRHSAPHRDLERLQVARERDRVMGAAMGGCIEALEAKWKSPTTTMDALTPEDMACVMAITTLKHIRDVLLAGESTYDPGMLAPWLTRAEPEPEREPAPEPVPDSAWGSDVSAAPPELASAAPDGQGASAPGSLALTTGPSHPQDPARLSAARVHSGPVRRTTHMFSSVSPSPSSVVYPIRGLNVPSRGPAQGHGPSERASSASGPLGRPGPVRPGPASVPSGQGSFGARARVPLQERLAAAASHQHQHQHQHQHRGSSEAAAASADTSTEPTGSLASSGPSLAHGAPTPLAKSSAPSSGRHGQQMAVAAEDPLGAL